MINGKMGNIEYIEAKLKYDSLIYIVFGRSSNCKPSIVSFFSPVYSG